jgi:hypothetical protein
MEMHDYDRVPVDDSAEMLALLRQSAASRTLCSVRAAGRPESYLSPLREVCDDGTAVLDAPRVPVLERALGPGNIASIDLRLKSYRVNFDARVEAIAGGGRHGMLRLSRPSIIMRLQRRETVRVRVPDAMRILLTLDPAEPSLTSIPMHELFVQGGSMSITGVRGRLEAGRLFEQARLTLPDAGEWPLTVRLAHAAVVRRGIDGSDMRLGIQFVAPSEGLESAVARVVGAIARSPGQARRA